MASVRSTAMETMREVGQATRGPQVPPRPQKPPRPERPPRPAKPDHLRPTKQTPCCICACPEKVWKCLQCDDSFCDKCWSEARPHQPGKVGYDGRQHEKVDEAVIKQLQSIFAGVSNKEQQERHEADKNTTWFGVHQDNGQSYLEHTSRLVDILQESQRGEHDERFPHLVSFVRQTGAGKSTIIKILMTYNRNGIHDRKDYPAPVPGLVGDNISTTGNVHLYADVQTYGSQQPILYADCEGLAGGENPPRGLVLWEGMESVKHPRTYVKQNLRALTRLKLKWADVPPRSRREFAVTQLFPRILYTFSEVVVFVLQQARTFESQVLKPLIDWAAKSIDKSINQPSRPHIIIVLNQTDPTISDDEWDPKHATDKLMDDVAASVKQVGALKEVVAKLEHAGIKINTTRELLEFYYSSVTVIRIPWKGRYMQMYTQVKLLHQTIGNKCSESYHQKQTIRMVLNSQRLPQYVNAAYHHFSQHLDRPFDFVKEAQRHMPLPKSFGEHILNLMLSIYSITGDNTKTTFTKLCRPIAACIMLAAVRDNTQGSYSSILHNAYEAPLKDAFFQFCDSWLRCSFQKGSQTCGNTKNAHEKGHQAYTGKLISKGMYQPSFDALSSFSGWIRDIDLEINSLNAPAEDSHREEKDFVPAMHRSVMNDFYNETVTRLELKSHLTCLYCLQKIPSNPLPCGHMLCRACVQSCGDTRGQGLYQLRDCPLHPGETRWPSPVNIRFKPKEAGVRVLCLDGGGVRGIVELAILRKMQSVLGDHVPIQNFFDLIVGTSTGGIIALGLGVKRWNVELCTIHFKNLCQQAFTPRGPSFLKPLAIAGYKSYYRTKPLEAALQSAFDDNTWLYGDQKLASPASIRVAVTATVASDGRPTILSNYNTEAERSHVRYGFLRPHDPDKELKVWQAARATSAAPPHFKDFAHFDASYIDGAMHYNCPVEVADQERRLLWEEVSDWPADLVLSLGTGYTDKANEIKPPIPRERSFIHFANVLRIAIGILETQMDCEEIWKRYHNGVMATKKMQRDEEKDRNIRINLKFPGKRPALDDANALDHIERLAQNGFQYNGDVWRAAHKLVATSFYFEKENIKPSTNGTYQCSGTILCRFSEGTDDLKGLGHIMQHLVKGDFIPCFLIQDCTAKVKGGHRVEFPLAIMDDMQKRGSFLLPPITDFGIPHYDSETNISLCLWPDTYTYGAKTTHDEAALFSISGFPRHLCSPQTSSLPKGDSDNGVEGSRESLDGASVGKFTDEVSADEDIPDEVGTSQPSLFSSPSIGSSGASLRSRYTLLGRGIPETEDGTESDTQSIATFRTAETRSHFGRLRNPFRGRRHRDSGHGVDGDEK
ncbi:hypothetical protein J3F83DRAFT_746226 [Trichoderma novae-zelandiae]